MTANDMDGRLAAAEERATQAEQQAAHLESRLHELHSLLGVTNTQLAEQNQLLDQTRTHWRYAQRLLRDVEWNGREGTQWKQFCPWCGAGQPESHHHDCKLAIMINGQRRDK